jgi:peptidoglycan/xylan/chitin deacetylase (PgdA/CDA1 family)
MGQQRTAPLYVCLSVDVDPDANRAAPGRPDAVSARCGESVALDACGQGLDVLAEIVQDMAIPCTLFWEARSLRALADAGAPALDYFLHSPEVESGCHGLRHEDFQGKESGVPLDEHDTLAVVREATDVIAQHAGARPRGFRAPYCRLTPALEAALLSVGYAYDASLTRAAGSSWGLLPYALPSGLAELALCRARDRSGKPITSYLWQMFEGRRTPDDHIRLISGLRDRFPGGLAHVALHPWHIVAGQDGATLGLQGGHNLRAVLKEMAALDRLQFTTAERYLASQGAGLK